MFCPNTFHQQLTPVDIFSFFFNEDILIKIAAFSNEYALQNYHTLQTNPNELRVFLAIILISGYSVARRRRQYWELSDDTRNVLIANSMRRNRFEELIKYLHLSDNMLLPEGDRFAKVRPLADHLNERFLAFGPHEENLSIDEGMIRYFGHHPTKQFMRQKPTRFGYKTWDVCTPEGYCLQFNFYQGKSHHEVTIGPNHITS